MDSSSTCSYYTIVTSQTTHMPSLHFTECTVALCALKQASGECARKRSGMFNLGIVKNFNDITPSWFPHAEHRKRSSLVTLVVA
mmetsp:Transcript_5160/g.14707  ORF Transcript_5160/g.14707 Transcript_5160/m.14707 type:complete len:84 (-) Transcript_5160:848-1099(-)